MPCSACEFEQTLFSMRASSVWPVRMPQWPMPSMRQLRMVTWSFSTDRTPARVMAPDGFVMMNPSMTM